MLEKLPHKNLFYFGFIVVFIFIGLSYWQLTRYQEDKQIIDSIDSKENINEITVSDLYDACLLYTSPSPRDISGSRMPSSA